MIIILLLLLVAVHGAQARCTILSGRYGEMVVCPYKHVVRGLCSSGKNADCGGYHTQIDCCPYSNTKGTQCVTFKGHYGFNVECSSTNNFIIGVCTSGKQADCAHTFSNTRCCSDDGLTVNPYDYYWLNGNYGVTITCGPGSVGCGMCSSGKNADCRAENGRKYFSRLKCCRLIN